MSPDDLLGHIRFARRYTARLLDATPPGDWSRLPPGGVSHITWQVGHLATAAYHLGLRRHRGRRPGDERLVADELLAAFGRQSAAGDAAPAEEVFAAYQRVHARIEAEWPELTAAGLDDALAEPHLLCRTRRDCLAWVAQHELVHAGQIGLLRRQLGHAPVW